MNLKYEIISFLIFTTILGSCKCNSIYVEYLNTTDTLVAALYNDDTLKVKSMLGVNPERIGEDLEHFAFKVRQTTKLLREYGLPNRKSYEIKEYPKESVDLIDIVVPIYSGDNSKLPTRMVVRFVKFLPSNKIAFFQLSGPFIERSTISPPSN